MKKTKYDKKKTNETHTILSGLRYKHKQISIKEMKHIFVFCISCIVCKLNNHYQWQKTQIIIILSIDCREKEVIFTNLNQIDRIS